jgi:hypothetical protein
MAYARALILDLPYGAMLQDMLRSMVVLGCAAALVLAGEALPF